MKNRVSSHSATTVLACCLVSHAAFSGENVQICEQGPNVQCGELVCPEDAENAEECYVLPCEKTKDDSDYKKAPETEDENTEYAFYRERLKYWALNSNMRLDFYG